MSILDYVEPESWRFYYYGDDDRGQPLFSFWMNVDERTGVCIYERNGGHGKWLSTSHEPEEYSGQPPSDELEAILQEMVTSERGVRSDRLDDLEAYEQYFVKIVDGTVEEKGKVAPEIIAYLEEVVGGPITVDESRQSDGADSR